MKSFLSILFAIFFSTLLATAQPVPPAQVDFEITITDSSKLVRVTPVINPLNLLLGDGINAPALVSPVFAVPAINGILSGYQITQFRRAYPASRFSWMRQKWHVRCNSLALAAALKAYDSTLFPSYKLVPVPKLLGYTPNDFPTNTAVPRNTKHLKYINAEDAWGISKGNTNVLIGVTDSYYDMDHPDLWTGTDKKIHSAVDTAYNPDGLREHGTLVAGLIACKTDNGIGYPAIGFNCRMRVSTNMTDTRMQQLSIYSDGVSRVRVLNGSWHDDYTSSYNPNFDRQQVYNEIYENGAVACFSAGNGETAYGGPQSYQYPASYDHNISVSSVGSGAPYGSGTYDVQDLHEINIGDSSDGNIFQHNDRVDICAPGVDIGGIRYDNDNDTLYAWNAADGTSLASPLVAGTAGLMFSAKPCLSPYQVEHLLKTTAKDIFTNRPENAKFAGRLGAGALDAGAAVSAASTFDCNDPATQTMYVEGIELNSMCAPGHNSVNSVLPKMKVRVVNGTPPYTYKWEPKPNENETTLDDYASGEPTITASTGDHVAYYRVTVYDNSATPKVASKMIRVKLFISPSSLLTMRDS